MIEMELIYVNDDLKNYLPTNIKFLRINKGMTQEELGKLLGKDNSTIGKWENGIRSPLMSEVFKMVSYFNVDIQDMITKDLRFEKIEQITANQFVSEVNDLLDKSDINDKQKNVIKAILENIKED